MQWTGTRRYYLFAIIWGIIGGLVSLLLLHHGAAAPSIGTVIAGAIIDVGAAAIAVMAGRTAKQTGRSPVSTGVSVGALYGFGSGWAAFGETTTRAEIVSALRKVHGVTVTPALVDQAAKAAKSPVTHVESWVTVIIVDLILGLIVAAIGGATAKKPGTPLDV